jgi:hypothetical protein
MGNSRLFFFPILNLFSENTFWHQNPLSRVLNPFWVAGYLGGAAGRREAAVTPAGAWEGARRAVQGRQGKKRRNRRVSCRPFRGVGFPGGPKADGILGSYPVARSYPVTAAPGHERCSYRA